MRWRFGVDLAGASEIVFTIVFTNRVGNREVTEVTCHREQSEFWTRSLVECRRRDRVTSEETRVQAASVCRLARKRSGVEHHPRANSIGLPISRVVSASLRVLGRIS